MPIPQQKVETPEQLEPEGHEEDQQEVLTSFHTAHRLAKGPAEGDCPEA